ncbi:hypothetical protein E2C01_041059 [Portunus trituberculatus]|uniref:Uncharacterized protein n=1 Tax=Portunus trituberculatus TaxID=210409 RepID=A0A5B7FPN2_PORTR|nr:hypothetical protein [Portunus trituberculatus]
MTREGQVRYLHLDGVRPGRETASPRRSALDDETQTVFLVGGDKNPTSVRLEEPGLPGRLVHPPPAAHHRPPPTVHRPHHSA